MKKENVPHGFETWDTLQPHKGPSETPRHHSRPLRESHFNPTRVHLKLPLTDLIYETNQTSTPQGSI